MGHGWLVRYPVRAALPLAAAAGAIWASGLWRWARKNPGLGTGLATTVGRLAVSGAGAAALIQAFESRGAGPVAGSLEEVTERCGHLPLALRIAAERIALNPYRPVSELVAELSTEEQLLDGLETDDSVSLRTAFESSYRDLNSAAARMFRLLSLHPDRQMSVHAAAALAGVPARQARRQMDKLVGVHLLEGTPTACTGSMT